jgi:hypothetical protein
VKLQNLGGLTQGFRAEQVSTGELALLPEVADNEYLSFDLLSKAASAD